MKSAISDADLESPVVQQEQKECEGDAISNENGENDSRRPSMTFESLISPEQDDLNETYEHLSQIDGMTNELSLC